MFRLAEFLDSLSNLFLKFVNLSLSASWLILAVIVLRRVLRKAPKWVFPMLWCLVLVRLMVPFSVESAMSLIPDTRPVHTSGTMQQPYIFSGIQMIDEPVNEYLGTPHPQSVTAPAACSISVTNVLSIIWLLGIAVLTLYTLLSYRKLRKRVTPSEHLELNVYESKNVASPFVLGLFRPRIYLPLGLSQQDRELVVAHEESHAPLLL